MNTVEKIFKEIESREESLIRKVIIFKSPLSNDLAYRVGYFQSYAEANIWEDSIKKTYETSDIDYSVYTNLVNPHE